MTAWEYLRAYVSRQKFDVTMREPVPGHFVIFDWTCHTLRAEGSSWEECARKLGWAP